jgi:chromosome segregation ATPase
MTRLDIARQRFDAALTALEEAVAQIPALRAQAADSRAKVAELTEERGRLLARIAELEEENRALGGITEEVEGRLDGAIAEIRGALGR